MDAPYPLFVLNAETSRYYVDNLYAQDDAKCCEALVFVKNCVMGSNRQKGMVLDKGILPRLLQMLHDQSKTPDIHYETMVILGSLAKGTEDQVKALEDANVVTYILRAFLMINEPKFTEQCLRCLCTILKFPFAKHSIGIFGDIKIIRKLIITLSMSISNSICVISILSYACRTAIHQKILWEEGICQILAELLYTEVENLSIATLNCIACVCRDNSVVSTHLVNSKYNGKTMPKMLESMLGNNQPTIIRLAASKCITLLYQAGTLEKNNSEVMFGALPTLTRLCKCDQEWKHRIEAAEILAVLIEKDAELQSEAYISNNLYISLTAFIDYPLYPLSECWLPYGKPDAKEMKQAAFKVFTSLGANSRDICDQIIRTDRIIDEILIGLQDPSPHVQLTTVKCLHSLSKSTKLLFLTMNNDLVWKCLMALLKSSSDETILCVTSAALSNLLLEFPPNKEPIIELGAIKLFCSFIKRDSLKYNGLLALVNIAFNAELLVKFRIHSILGIDQIFSLLFDSQINIPIKALELLNNLLSNRDVDPFMKLCGRHILQVVNVVLERDPTTEMERLALLILDKICSGDDISTSFITRNYAILGKIREYMINGGDEFENIEAFYCMNL